VGGAPTLWKVPMEGGQAVEISRQPASFPRVSPDGGRLGCIYFPGKDPRFSAVHVALLGMDGKGGFKIFESSPSDGLSWSPDGKGLDYILNKGGVGNIWRQPVDGGPAEQVTRFASEEIYAFAWSDDRRLVCARGNTIRGMVLIEDFR
jgi:Tol biopolymer transport system component